jgi:hypothetical protein
MRLKVAGEGLSLRLTLVGRTMPVYTSPNANSAPDANSAASPNTWWLRTCKSTHTHTQHMTEFQAWKLLTGKCVRACPSASTCCAQPLKATRIEQQGLPQQQQRQLQQPEDELIYSPAAASQSSSPLRHT